MTLGTPMGKIDPGRAAQLFTIESKSQFANRDH